MTAFANILKRYLRNKVSSSLAHIPVSKAYREQVDVAADHAYFCPQTRMRPTECDLACDIALAAKAVLTPEQYRFFRVYHLAQKKSKYRDTIGYRLMDAEVVRLVDGELRRRWMYPYQRYFNDPLPFEVEETLWEEQYGKLIDKMLYTTVTMRILKRQLEDIHTQTPPHNSLLLPRTVSEVIEDTLRPTLLRDPDFFKRKHTVPTGPLVKVRLRIRTDYLDLMKKSGLGQEPALRVLLGTFGEVA